jgi:hypothetical protein
MQIAFLTLCVVVPLGAASPARAQKSASPAPAFTVRGIGPPFFSDAYLPNSINNAGVVVGANISGPVSQSFFFAKGKVHAVLPPSGMAGSAINGVNNSDTVAGQGCLASACDVLKAFTGLIRKGIVKWKALPGPAGSSLCNQPGCDSAATGIAPSGDVTGAFAHRAVLWVRGAKGGYAAKRLPYSNAAKFNTSSGLAVDNFGDVAGREGNGTINIGVFWPRHGSPLLLPECENLLVFGGTFGSPSALLAKGSTSKRTVTIVGQCLVKSSTTSQTGNAPCVWHVRISPSGDTISAPQRLDANDGSADGKAAALNQQGWIAGNQGDATSSPTLWIKAHPYLLNSVIAPNSGWTLNAVYAMNDRGQIVGTGENQSGSRAFMLTPR